MEKKEKLFVLFILFLIYLIYLPSINGPFLFDDDHMIVKNLFITNVKYLSWVFRGYVTNAPIPKGMLRPILMLTFFFNYLYSGLNPIGYHIINILLHFLNTIFLFTLLRYLSQLYLNRPLSWGVLVIVVTLFAVHPINTEAISYISSRSDLLVTFCILSGFILYLKKRYIFSTLMYVMALLSKETGLCFGIIIVAYEAIEIIRKPSSLKQKKEKLFLILTLIILTIIYLIYRKLFFLPPPSHSLRSFYSNILIQMVVTLLYLKLFLIPHPLNLTHYVPEFNSLLSSPVILSFLFILGLIIIAILCIKKYPLVTLGIVWIFIGLLPKFYARLNFVAMEHHFYLSSIGIYILLSFLLMDIYKKRKRYSLYISIGLITLFSLLTLMRNYEYHDPFLFLEISARRNPLSGTLAINLGTEYLNKGYIKEAEAEFKRAIRLKSRKESTAYGKINLALIYIKKKDYTKAESYLKDVLKEYPKLTPPGTYNLMGIISDIQGDKNKAERYWQKEIQLYPTFSAEAHFNLGALYLKKKELSKARRIFLKAVNIFPNQHIAYLGLGKVLEQEGKTKEALMSYRKAVFLNPKDPQSHYALGSLSAQMGKGNALYELKKAIELKPDFAQAYNDLAVLYASMTPPKWELAYKSLKKAEKLGFAVNKEFRKLVENHLNKTLQ